MSSRVSCQIQILSRIQALAKAQPNQSVFHLRRTAEKDVARELGLASYRTPQAHLRRKDSVYELDSMYLVDKLIEKWLSGNSEDIREYYSQGVSADDLVALNSFFLSFGEMPLADFFDQQLHFKYPEELDESDSFIEGIKQTIVINKYERSEHARRRCIEHFGATCYVCGFDFAEDYGAVGQGVIHVHHLVPLSEVQAEYKIDPVRDLILICPNCHTIAHQRKPPFTVEEIRGMLRTHRDR
ncbi:MAG: HNH endonuclease [Caldilineales bacterium]